MPFQAPIVFIQTQDQVPYANLPAEPGEPVILKLIALQAVNRGATA